MPVYLVGLSPEADEVQVPLQQQTSEDMTTQQQQQNGSVKGASALMEPQMIPPIQQDNECECRNTSLNILKSCARTRSSFFWDVARCRLIACYWHFRTACQRIFGKYVSCHVGNNQTTLCNNIKQRRFRLHRSASLNQRILPRYLAHVRFPTGSIVVK